MCNGCTRRADMDLMHPNRHKMVEVTIAVLAAYLIAQNYALGRGSGAAQRNGEPGMAGEVAALRDGTHKRRPSTLKAFGETITTYRAPACSRPWIGFRST